MSVCVYGRISTSTYVNGRFSTNSKLNEMFIWSILYYLYKLSLLSTCKSSTINEGYSPKSPVLTTELEFCTQQEGGIFVKLQSL